MLMVHYYDYRERGKDQVVADVAIHPTATIASANWTPTRSNGKLVNPRSKGMGFDQCLMFVSIFQRKSPWVVNYNTCWIKLYSLLIQFPKFTIEKLEN